MHGTIRRGQFGFTNSAADLDAVVAWREAAIADGWDHEATYAPIEGEDRACRLRRDGFVALVISRKNDEGAKWLAEAEVDVWGPDGMSLHKIPDVYDWSAIKAAVETCGYCGAHPVKTGRVGFAGRACPACLPVQTAKLPLNWTE